MRSSSRWRELTAAVGVLAAVGIIVGLVYQKRAVMEDYHRTLWERSVPRTGAYLPDVRLATITGDYVEIAPEGAERRQILLYFTTDCPYCRASLDSWKRLSAEVEDRVTVIGLSLSPADSTLAYAAANDLRFPIATIPPDSHRLNALLRTGTIPATVVVDRNGRILFTRLGVVETSIVADSIREAALYQLEGGTS